MNFLNLRNGRPEKLLTTLIEQKLVIKLLVAKQFKPRCLFCIKKHMLPSKNAFKTAKFYSRKDGKVFLLKTG